MAENYQSKKERWKRLRETFPVPLRQIALSLVDSIAALEDPARELLAETLSALDSLPKAILLLDIFPDMDEENLLQLVNTKKKNSWQSLKSPAREKSRVLDNPVQESPKDILALANLLQSFYAQMPRTAAESLASSGSMKEALNVLRAVRIAREETNSDFVILCLYGLFKESKKLLAEDIKANPSFLNTARQSNFWDE